MKRGRGTHEEGEILSREVERSTITCLSGEGGEALLRMRLGAGSRSLLLVVGAAVAAAMEGYCCGGGGIWRSTVGATKEATAVDISKEEKQWSWAEKLAAGVRVVSSRLRFAGCCCCSTAISGPCCSLQLLGLHRVGNGLDVL